MAHIRVFKHYVHLPFIMLGLIDFTVLMASFYLSAFFLFFTHIGLFVEYWDQVLYSAIFYTLLIQLIMIATGVYESQIEEGLSGMMLRSILSIIIAIAMLSFFVYISGDTLWYFTKGQLSLASVLAVFSIGIFRAIFFLFAHEGLFKRRVLVLGAGHRARNLATDLTAPLDRKGFDIVGYIPMPDEEVKVGRQHLLNVPNNIQQYVEANNIEEIVVAVDDRRKTLPLDDLLNCKMVGINVIDGSTFYERESKKVPLEMIQPSWMIFSDGFNVGRLNAVIRRTFDIIASLLLLSVSWPLMLLTILCIKLEEGIRAPVIYSQERVGLNGRSFFVHKFRSMRTDAEKKGEAIWAQKNDTRVTKVGEFIRKVRIDELPQIFNVLVGDMSFVGPRPERPVFVNQLSENIPYYSERHRVKPGITGWAQLCFAYADSEEDSREKLQYDLYYIKNQSLLLDILILIQTVEVVLFKKGSR